MGDVDQGTKGAMDRALHQLRAGQMTFTAFERATRADWTRLARMVHQRWPLPPAVGVEDVRQEMLLALVIRKASSQNRTLIEKWGPERGVSLARYCVWNAIVAACRWLHPQRGAKKTAENKGVAGKSPSCFARPLSSFVREGDDGEARIPEPVVQAEQDQGRVVEELIAQVFQKLRSPSDRTCLRAYLVEEGDMRAAGEAAARDLTYLDLIGGMRTEARSPREGRRAVNGAIRRARWATKRVMASEERV
jgi:hypothetical protein